MSLKHKTILTVSAALSLAFGGLATAPIAAAEAVFTSIPQAQMKAVWTDSVETGGEGANGPLDKVLDGDAKSYWHTVWYQGTGNNEMPHRFIIDLGKEVPDLGRVTFTRGKVPMAREEFTNMRLSAIPMPTVPIKPKLRI